LQRAVVVQQGIATCQQETVRLRFFKIEGQFTRLDAVDAQAPGADHAFFAQSRQHPESTFARGIEMLQPFIAIEVLGDIVNPDDVQTVSLQALETVFDGAQGCIGAVVVDHFVRTAVVEHPSLVVLTPEDLQTAQWICVASNLAQRTTGPHTDSFVAACMKAGFSPDIHLEVTEPMTALRLVGAGLGIAMLQRNLRSSAPDNVVLREVPWMQYTTPVWATWHRINLRPLVAMAREVLLGGKSASAVPERQGSRQ
jgi:hypothetical protein